MIATQEAEYAGKTFGDLTVVRKVNSNVMEAKWLCLCTCNRNTIVATSKLKRGQTCCSICSRLKRDKPSNFINLTGKRFGNLVVIKQGVGKKNSNAVWVCKCDCGNELSVVGTQLINQKYCIKCKPGAINGEKKYNDKEKYCPKCKDWKPLESFPKKKNSASGRDSYCYPCFKEYRRKWVRNKFYGITDEEFNKAFEEQNGSCALCGRYNKLVIDHCHKTGKFRGLICSLCNSIIGRVDDSIELLQKAILYINKHTK